MIGDYEIEFEGCNGGEVTCKDNGGVDSSCGIVSIE